MIPADVLSAASELVKQGQAVGMRVATAESCTGGLLAGAITAVAGSSAVFERGWVTYSNASKTTQLDVPEPLIVAHGAVSQEVAAAMAEGALAHSLADLAISITGVAGPDGGGPGKPVGLVCFGVFQRQAEAPVALMRQFDTLDRHGVRMASVRFALDVLLDAVRARSGAA